MSSQSSLELDQGSQMEVFIHPRVTGSFILPDGYKLASSTYLIQLITKGKLQNNVIVHSLESSFGIDTDTPTSSKFTVSVDNVIVGFSSNTSYS